MCEPAHSKCTWTCHQSHCMRNFQEKCRTPDMRRTFCVSQRSRNAHGHVTGASLCRNLQVKCDRPKAQQAFCASRRSRSALGQITRAYKSHLMREFTGRKPEARLSTLIQHPHRKNPSVWTLLGGEKKSTSVRVSFNRDTPNHPSH